MKLVLLSALIIAIGVSSTPAQIKEGKSETDGSLKVAVVNIGYVFNHYERAKVFKTDLERAFAPYKKKSKKISDEIDQLQKDTKGNDDIGVLQARQALIVQRKRELEEISIEMQQELGKKQEQNLIDLWKDVQGAIKAYATDKKIDLVFGYGDPLEKGMMDLFPNINRKMQAMDTGGAVPLFASSRVEISPAVTDLLNARWREKAKRD
jgi:Skp family chaperone for outer membrane proteins